MASDLNTIIVMRDYDVSSPLKKKNRYEQSGHDFRAEDDMEDMDELDTTKEAEMASMLSSVVAELKEAGHLSHSINSSNWLLLDLFPCIILVYCFFWMSLSFLQQAIQ